MPSQRFETFSKTQNIGITSVNSIKSSDVYNTVTNKLTEVTQDLKNIANSITGTVLPKGVTLQNIDDKINDAIRATKDTFTSIQDFTRMSVKDVENAIAELLPGDPTLQNMFRTLTSQCRDSALGGRPNFKPFKDTGKCGSGNGKCDTASTNGLFNKLTGGLIGAVTKTIQSLLNTLVTLANLGYSASLCKIFSALADNLPSGVIQRGAAAILAVQGGKGNTTAVLDVTANMGKVNPSREIPGLTKRVAENYKTPDNFKPGTRDTLYEGYATALGSIQPGYNKTEDELTTVENLGETNVALAETMQEYMGAQTVTDFKEPVIYEDMEMTAVYVANSANFAQGDRFFG